MSTVFDLEILKNGSEQDINQQLENWRLGTNNSIYVRWVPDEMLPNKAIFPEDAVARSFFEQFGVVNRFDFVPKYNEHNKQTGHMLFVHYDKFYDCEKVNRIVEMYPQAVQFEWKKNPQKLYSLKCSVNTRPAPRVEFNTSQLTDMIQLLNTRLTNENGALSERMGRMMEENSSLRSQVAMMKLQIASITRTLSVPVEDISDKV